MKKRYIKVHGINDAIELVDMANKVDGDITISRGKYAIDAKSILGVMAINTAAGVLIEYPANNDDFDQFISRFEALSEVKNE